jgi:hypothetical protein
MLIYRRETKDKNEVKTGLIPEDKTYFIGEDNSIKLSYVKRFNALVKHLESLKTKNIVNKDTIDEILLQFSLLELRRNELSKHIGEVVVVCNGELFFGKDLTEATKQARIKYGKRPHYSESIDIVEYPSIFE